MPDKANYNPILLICKFFWDKIFSTQSKIWEKKIAGFCTKCQKMEKRIDEIVKNDVHKMTGVV